MGKTKRSSLKKGDNSAMQHNNMLLYLSFATLIISLVFANFPVLLSKANNIFSVGLTSKSTSHIMINTRICLNIIAKNEEDGIIETLEAALPHISGWMVCDTGSTDNTTFVVEEFFKNEKHIKGQIVHHKWKNFSHNKNLCMKAARDILGSWCDYLLILDADQILKYDDEINLSKMSLTDDAYWLHEISNHAAFSNMRLVKASLPWKYVGSVHEYIMGDGFHPKVGSLPTGIYTKHDANLTIARFERDEVLLRQELAENPHNDRAQFYLAQTYAGLFKPEDAILNYVKRIQMGGWDEEVYLSYTKIAHQLEFEFVTEKRNLTDRALHAVNQLFPNIKEEVKMKDVTDIYVAAYKSLPYRKESLYHLARIYRQYLDNLEACFTYAKEARDKGKGKSTALFVDTPVVQYHIYNEMCICGYYVGKYKDGRDACHQLQHNLESAADFTQWHAKTLDSVRAILHMYQEKPYKNDD